jgi:histidyl-tRNA synthetase
VLNFGEKETQYSFKIVDLLRGLDVRTELFPDPVKLKKQMSYADSKKIPYIIMAGEDEIINNDITIKVMSTGEQKKIPFKELNSFVKEEIKKFKL